MPCTGAVMHALQLIVLNFYSFLQRYLQPFQKGVSMRSFFLISFLCHAEVTLVLTYTAQATHDLVPSDTIEPLIAAIANSFVSERSSPESIAVGFGDTRLFMCVPNHDDRLNAIREICVRCPLAMNEDLLSDLVQYKAHRDKSTHVHAVLQ